MKPKILFLIIVGLCVPLPAMAYVDPGSGMLIWQGLIALVGAVIVFLRNPVAVVKELWKRLRRK